DEANDERRFAFESFYPGPVKPNCFGHVICFDFKLAALQSFYLAGHSIAIFQDDQIVGVFGKGCWPTYDSQKEDPRPNILIRHLLASVPATLACGMREDCLSKLTVFCQD